MTWAVYWSVSPNHPFNASACNIYMGGEYDSGGFARTQVSSINGEITNPPSSGQIFLQQPIMSSYLQLLAACKSRGTIPFIAPAFTGQVDSAQQAWTDSWSIQVPNGTDLFTLLQEYVGSIGGDFIMQPGFILQVGAQGSLGTDRSQTIIFPDGQVTQKGRTQDRTAIANLVAAQDADGQMRTSTSAGSVTQWLQREKLAAAGGSLDSVAAENLAAATLDQTSQQVDQRILQIPPNQPHRTVWQDFAVFDWVGVERADYSAVDACQVIGITVSIDQDGGETHELVLQTYRQWIIAQLQYLINKFGGQSVSTLGALPPNAVTGLGGSLLMSPPAALTGQASATSPSSSTVSQTPSSVPGSSITPGTVTEQQLSFTLSSGVQVTFGPTAPSNPNVGDLWYNTSNGNQVSTWNGTTWAVQLFGVPAVSFAATDIGGIMTYVQASAPVGAAAGSLWFDTSNGFRLNQFDGSSWGPYQWGTNAIANLAITGVQIANNTITAAQILANTITASQIAANTITAGQIAALTITAAQIAANTITAGQIQAGTITATQIAATTITAAKIAANTITASQIAANTITASQLAAGIVYAGIVDATTVQALQYIATGTQGQFLAYNGTPGSGNLNASIAGYASSDTYSNPFPVGIMTQALTLQNQSSAPTPMSGADVFYAAGGGRPRFISSSGDNSVIERSTVNVFNWTVGNTTSPTAISAPLSYIANEGNQSSEYEIEICGSLTWPASGFVQWLMQLYIDTLPPTGSGTISQFTVGVGLSGASVVNGFRITATLAFLQGGSSGTAMINMSGILWNSSGARTSATTQVVGSQSGSFALDATANHTLQIAAWDSSTSTGATFSTLRTRLTRRMLWLTVTRSC